MKNFKKADRLCGVAYDIRGPVMQQAAKMIADGQEVLKLNLGNPAPFDFRAPKEIIDTLKANLENTEGYSASNGLQEAREAIARYCQHKGIPNVRLQDIYTGNGVSELIIMSMQAFLNQDDEVLVPAPDYPLWTASVKLAGGNPVHYVCDENSDWMPDLEDMRRKITPRTKGIVVINPNNPTGALYPKEVLQQIVDLAREKNLVIFADEIYDRLVMDGQEHVAIASLAPDLFTVNFNGLSKSHLIAGFRCGWMCLGGDKSCAKDFIGGLDLLSNMRLCSNVPAQSVIPIALQNFDTVDPLFLPGGRIYEQREYIYNALNSIPGMQVKKPKAAFYIFPKMDIQKFGIVDDEQFALDFLKEKNVLLTHGTAFNWANPDHFRIVYLPKVEELKTAMENLADFLATYHQSQGR